jgi:hypothetical protein
LLDRMFHDVADYPSVAGERTMEPFVEFGQMLKLMASSREPKASNVPECELTACSCLRKWDLPHIRRFFIKECETHTGKYFFRHLIDSWRFDSGGRKNARLVVTNGH